MTDQHAPWTNATIQKIFSAYQSAGYEIRLAGGCVRDILLGVEPKDYDFAVTCDPETSMQIGRDNGYKVAPTGLKHGTISVHVDNQVFEITTLRIDVESDGRWAVVKFTDDWAADAARRDFTINALFMDSQGRVHDYVSGMVDIASSRVVFVGQPLQRLEEDALRALRAVRFASRFKSEMPTPLDNTDWLSNDAGSVFRSKMSLISRERITTELCKMFSVQQLQQLQMAADHLQSSGLAKFLQLPIRQGKYSKYLTNPSSNAMINIAFFCERFADCEKIADATKLSRIQKSDLFSAFRVIEAYYSMTAADWYKFVRTSVGTNKISAYTFNTVMQMVSPALPFSAQWLDIPQIPLTAGMIMEITGLPQGKRLGAQFEKVMRMWIETDFSATKSDLIKVVDVTT